MTVNRIAPVVLAFVAWSVLVASASAQPEGPPPAPPGANLASLALQKAVTEELKLTTEEIDRLKPLVEGDRGVWRGLRDLSEEERRKKMQEIKQANDKKVADVIEPDQYKRLKQISWQVLGPFAFRDPAIVSGLNMTAEEQEKSDKIRREGRDEMGQLFEKVKGNFDGETIEKFSKISDATKDKIVAILTSEQKAKWQEMLGPEFTGKLDFGGFGRR